MDPPVSGPNDLVVAGSDADVPQPAPVQAGVRPAGPDELGVRPSLDDAAGVEGEDLVGALAVPPCPWAPMMLRRAACVLFATNLSRFRCDCAAVLVPARAAGHDREVDLKMTLAFTLIGLGAVAAGGLGLRLPAGERIAAGLTLVVGAGVGVVGLAVGTQMVSDSPEAYESLFLTASALGFVATVASLVLLWRWTSRDAEPRSGEPSAR